MMVLDRLWPGAPWVCGKDCLLLAIMSVWTQLVFIPLPGSSQQPYSHPPTPQTSTKPELGSCTFTASHFFFFLIRILQ